MIPEDVEFDDEIYACTIVYNNDFSPMYSSHLGL
jgi:hypothetical protein